MVWPAPRCSGRDTAQNIRRRCSRVACTLAEAYRLGRDPSNKTHLSVASSAQQSQTESPHTYERPRLAPPCLPPPRNGLWLWLGVWLGAAPVLLVLFSPPPPPTSSIGADSGTTSSGVGAARAKAARRARATSRFIMSAWMALGQRSLI